MTGLIEPAVAGILDTPALPGGRDIRRALVTGATGFIGSHLVESLVAQSVMVTALDRRSQRFEAPPTSPQVEKIRLDLTSDELDAAVAGCDVVFHLAARPGVRSSWGDDFSDYLSANVTATQRLLEACMRQKTPRLVFASSSSVYGSTMGSSREDDELRPMSLYGVTKLAAEQLCLAYTRRTNSPLSVVALRYFTVYGPRQRPDMMLGRAIFASYSGIPLTLYGDGTQRREFTYVTDVVAATIAAGRLDQSDEVINVGGGSSVSLIEALDVVSRVTGRPVPLDAADPQAGDVPSTHANLYLAQELLGYRPAVDLTEGIRRQAEWMLAVERQPLLDAYTQEAQGAQGARS
jgi:nucleoside-diphosphate-sugar epimerase